MRGLEFFILISPFILSVFICVHLCPIRFLFLGWSSGLWVRGEGLLGSFEGNDPELGNVHQSPVGQLQLGDHGKG